MSYFSPEREAEMRQIFFEGAQELLQVLNEEALKLEIDEAKEESARTIRRAVHTLKGDAAACGFRELSELAHELEDALVPEVATSSPAETAELVLSAADVFDAMLAAYKGKLQAPATEPLRAMIQNLRSSVTMQTVQTSQETLNRSSWSEYDQLAIDQALAAGAKTYCVLVELDSQCPMKSAARQLLENVLQQAGQVLAVAPRGAISNEVCRIQFAIASKEPPNEIEAKCRIPAVASQVRVEAIDPSNLKPAGKVESEASSTRTSLPTSVTGGIPGSENILRVDAERIDHVLNLIGELIIGRSMLYQLLSEFAVRFPRDPLRSRFSDAMAFQSRVLNDLQRTAMQIRMVPVENLFRRFPRLIRDLAKQCGKEVGLILNGQDTELDKSILDAVAEPLAHLVRNAVDHGIESNQERRKLGKAAKGMIRMNAYHQGNHVVIEVGDDGKGMDPAAIRKKAVEQHLITAEEANRLTEPETLELVFRPGFSTAEQVTEISGRGVGLDVVQTVIQRLKGTVSIDSTPGGGTTFQLKVPLTLAIIKALLLRIGQRLCAIPLNAVVEIARVHESEIHNVDSHEVLQLRNAVLTLIRLGRKPHLQLSEARQKLFVVVISLGERKYGLIVDSLVGEEELVIKPLDDHVITTDLVSGASILGDGTVVLILNLPAVVEHYAKRDLPQFMPQDPIVATSVSSGTELDGGVR